MNTDKFIELTDNQMRDIDGGWFFIKTPAGLAPLTFQILSIKSFVEGYQDATKTQIQSDDEK